MTLDFWNRTLLASLVTTLLVGLCSAVYCNMTWAGRYTLVSLWTVGNFWLLGRVLLLVATKSRAWKIALWVLFKIAGWYTLGYWMLRYIGIEPTSLLIGFHTFFAVLILKTVGKRMTRKQVAVSGRQ